MPVNPATHVRLLLLVVVTGLFAAVWIGDRPPQGHVATAVTRTRSGPAVSPANATPELTEPVAWVAPSAPMLPALSVADVLTGHLELPAEIAVGEYRVIETDGTVSTLTLTAADLQYMGRSAEAIPQDIYRITSERGTWFAVRVESDNARHSRL